MRGPTDRYTKSTKRERILTHRNQHPTQQATMPLYLGDIGIDRLNDPIRHMVQTVILIPRIKEPQQLRQARHHIGLGRRTRFGQPQLVKLGTRRQSNSNESGENIPILSPSPTLRAYLIPAIEIDLTEILQKAGQLHFQVLISILSTEPKRNTKTKKKKSQDTAYRKIERTAGHMGNTGAPHGTRRQHADSTQTTHRQHSSERTMLTEAMSSSACMRASNCIFCPGSIFFRAICKQRKREIYHKFDVGVSTGNAKKGSSRQRRDGRQHNHSNLLLSSSAVTATQRSTNHGG